MSVTSAEPQGGPFAVRIARALFEIEAGAPGQRARMVLRVVSALFLVLLVWAIFARLDIVAVAHGRLVPQTYLKIVQPAEAGIVRQITVKEGETVARGQVLVRLDPTINAADSTAVAQELAMQRMQQRRIEAELAGKPMVRRFADDPALFDRVEAQRASHRQAFLHSLAQQAASRQRATKELAAARELLQKLDMTLPSYRKAARAYEKLARDHLVGAIQAEERRREAIEKSQDLAAQRATVASLAAAIEQIDQRLAQVRSTYASDLNQLRLESITAINRLEQEHDKLSYQRGLLELRAPQAGIVKELATTTVGAVVQPGAVLLSLVPLNEPLLAEVLIENQDIGFVMPDQPVRVKVAAYQFQKYGMLEGRVKTVSADSTTPADRPAASRDDRGSPAFKALIELQDQQLKAGGLVLPLASGMQVSAEIVQGSRTVLGYLLSPIRRVASEAAKER